MHKHLQSGIGWVGALLTASSISLQVLRHSAVAIAKQAPTQVSQTNQLESWARFEAQAKQMGAITLAFKMKPDAIARYEKDTPEYLCLYKEVYPNDPMIKPLDQEIWQMCVAIHQLKELTDTW